MPTQDHNLPQSRFPKSLLLCAGGAGLAFLLAGTVGVSPTILSILKGTGPFFLSLYAASQARTLEGWMLAIVMLLCALGDGLITSHVAIATLMTAMAHMVSTALYVRHRRPSHAFGRTLMTCAVVPFTMLAAWQLPIGIGTEDAIGTLAYSFFVSLMVAAAWSSRFAPSPVGIGVTLFLISDLMLFGIMGPLPGTDLVRALIWTLYLSGQILITIGVVQTLSSDSNQKSRNL
jgi:uncharacterized membrane protein YhhN